MNDLSKLKIKIIPTILKTLLDQRKATKRKIKTAETDDKKKVYECLQLQYKLTANSVYGQLGAKTSSVFFKKTLQEHKVAQTLF